MIRQTISDEVKRGKIFEDIANDEHFWSTPFSIDALDDFQISYPMDTVAESAEKKEWHSPSHFNNFMRYVRILVTTQNDASILIVITTPVYPEYEIVNETGDDIEVAQLKEGSMMSGITKKFSS